MSVSVELPEPKNVTPSKGSAGLQSWVGGVATTVSVLMEMGNATGNASLVKKSIG